MLILNTLLKKFIDQNITDCIAGRDTEIQCKHIKMFSENNKFENKIFYFKMASKLPSERFIKSCKTLLANLLKKFIKVASSKYLFILGTIKSISSPKIISLRTKLFS